MTRSSGTQIRRKDRYEVRFTDEEHRGRWIQEVVREIPRD
jgi:hypothetical protein